MYLDITAKMVLTADDSDEDGEERLLASNDLVFKSVSSVSSVVNQ